MNTLSHLETIFSAILSMTLHVSALICLVLLAQRAFKRWLTPGWRHALWLLVLIRMCLPSLPESPFSVLNYAQLFQRDETPAVAVTPSPASEAPPAEEMETIGAPLESLYVAPPENAAPPGINMLFGQRDLEPVEQASEPTLPWAPGPVAMGPATIQWSAKEIGALVWLIGALVFLAVFSSVYVRTSRRLARQPRIDDPRILGLLAEARKLLGVSTRVSVIATDLVSSPALFGLWKPRLLLPLDLIRSFDDRQLRHVFLHEMAHLKRHDPALNWLMTGLQILHWFNPFVWLAFRQMRSDRETASDALVLSRANKAEARDYGHTLLELFEQVRCPSSLPGTVGILEDRTLISRRIRLIAEFREAKSSRLIGGALPIALGLVMLTGAQSDAAPKAKAAASSEGTNLLERYPTSLTAGLMKPQPWNFNQSDIYRLTRFEFQVGDQLKMQTGPADLGIGHCDKGAVWAVVLPRQAGTAGHGQAEKQESITHVWLRFHPGELNRLFPPKTVVGEGNRDRVHQILIIATAKIRSSWQGGGQALIPPPEQMTVDFDTAEGNRRFFMVDRKAKTAEYVDAFAKRAVPKQPKLTKALARKTFDELWQAFDQNYAMFAIRPEVDWQALRDKYRPLAEQSKTTEELAGHCAEMLAQLRDLHVWLKASGQHVPIYNRPRKLNANPRAHKEILGKMHTKGRRVHWSVTKEPIGFIAVTGWDDRGIPAQFGEVLEQMRDTRGLIIDVRLNGGGSEPLAQKVAARFLEKEYVYSYSQYRNGPKHTDLTKRFPRTAQPGGPWRYDRPVVLLIGEKCMSSNESFAAMMEGAANVTTMGDRTAGSSGNPKMVKLPLEFTVSVPKWIDYLADGKPLDGRGVQPQVRFEPKRGAFEGNHDDLLSAALARLRKSPPPSKPIEGPVFDRAALNLPNREKRIREDARNPDIPQIVSVFPAPDAKNVPITTELRIRFDRPMDPLAAKLDWDAGGFLSAEFPIYDEQSREFRVPLRLQPGALHQVVINRPHFDHWKRADYPLTGFLSAHGQSAALFAWRFHTRDLPSPPADAVVPKTLSVTPASGSKTPLLNFVTIRFDQPMARPENNALSLVSKETGALAKPSLVGPIEHDRERHSFRLTIVLAPGRESSFSLSGFRSAKGVPAKPIQLRYETSTNEFGNAHRLAMQKASQSAELVRLLKSMQQSRKNLKSLDERVQSLTLTREERGLYRSMNAQRAFYRWTSGGRFYADVSQMMYCADYRIGSDGKTSWIRGKSLQQEWFKSCPLNRVHELDFVICDPFELTAQDPVDAARGLGLKLLNPGDGLGSTPHMVSAWSIRRGHEDRYTWGAHKKWMIDPDSHRVREVTINHGNALMRTRFFYDKVNETLPAELFQAPNGGRPKNSLEPVNEDYNRRFIKMHDGSSGSISLRWGRKGPKGRYSSGLN